MRLTQVGKTQPLMRWHQAGPSHGIQSLWLQSTQRLGYLLTASGYISELIEGLFRKIDKTTFVTQRCSLGTLCSCLTGAGEGPGTAPCLVSVCAPPAGSEPLLTELLCPEWLCGWLLCPSRAERFPAESGVENEHMRKLRIRNNKLKITFSSDKIISLFSCLSAEKATFNKQTPGSNHCHSATYQGTDPEEISPREKPFIGVAVTSEEVLE